MVPRVRTRSTIFDQNKISNYINFLSSYQHSPTASPTHSHIVLDYIVSEWVATVNQLTDLYCLSKLSDTQLYIYKYYLILLYIESYCLLTR